MLSINSDFFESLHKEQWKEVRLGEMVKTNCKSIDKNYPYNIVQYLDTGSITDNKIESFQKFDLVDLPSRAKRLVQDNDIIYSLVRPIQRHFGFIKNPSKNLVVSTGFCTITTQQNILNSKFLYYFLILEETIEFLDLIAEASTSTYPAIKPSDIENLIIPLPPLETQRKIAEILSSFDDKIDLLTRQNKTLESLALTLFYHTFIDNPNRDEWEMGKLGDWLIETIGGDWGKEKPINDFQEKVFCIRGTDIADLNKGLADKTPIRYIKKNKLSMLEPKEGDIIFEISGGTETQSTGRCVFVNQQVKILFEYPIVFSNFCRLLKVKKKEYSYFLYLYLQYLYHSDEFFALENGTSGIKNLNYKALFYELEYKMPSEIQVIEFHTKVKIYFDTINANKKQIQNLQSMHDMLLSKILKQEY